ncbi:hypothetical protein [Streptomyces sp. VB1]|uniref:hypothetical protein n=1 Tax=Streptomyces sp. VB1 TaxID=2986803 RepID=UPI002242BDFC|nr:hypothetical protein [Streptomyces sp. VB1]UZI30765.1 hypothetical protein OH133_23135 [Streptomyces sp. VB1]
MAEDQVLRSRGTLGLRMSEIREAAAAVREAFDTPYGLVSKRFGTDGVDIFVEHGLGALRRARYGQAPIQEVVAQYLRYRVPVQAITDLSAAGETVEDIAYDFDMPTKQVGALCEAMVRLAA